MATKRRVRSSHSGVVLKRRTNPSGAVVWRARFVDPDTGKETYQTLTEETNAEARRMWAIDKSKELAQRRRAIEGGAQKVQKVVFGEALDGFVEAAKNRLRGRTIEAYNAGIELLKAWGQQAGVRSTLDINPARLRGFRDWLIARPKQSPVRGKGARRGTRQAAVVRLSPTSVNSYLRAVKAALNELRRHGQLAQLTSDSIRDALAPLPVPREHTEYLPAAQCRDLLACALQHDAARFALTRQEKKRGLLVGTTPRYARIAPFVAFTLLTGCRLNEGLELKWSSVDLDALDDAGRTSGEIRLAASETKTGHARTIGMEVSPGLRRMLQLMKEHRGDSEYVFGGAKAMSRTLAESSRKRLVGSFAACDFSWQMLRRTCGTFLTNAPGIYGAASAYMSARQLGHSVAIAERHYLGVVRGISRDARTLDAAMQIEATLADLYVALGGTRDEQETAIAKAS